MDRETQLQLYTDFIQKCTKVENSWKDYTGFKRINECLQELFPERKDISILDYDDPIDFGKVVKQLDSLKTYIDFNVQGKTKYSNTVGWYQRFLNAKHLFLTQRGVILSNFDLSNLPLQQIFYGAPGTGKSHGIKYNEKVRISDEKNLVFRTTFHPDSDYSTFVGAYKPTLKPVADKYKAVAGKDEEITYEFIPQAFLQAYIAAWNNREEDVFLVIEEINRGNCAQIFGDLFQLLDRDDNGFSEYPIMADRDLAKFFTSNDVLVNKDGIKDGKLLLPANLYIWATMNTSDQSLFPIDSAFKRRWEWKYIPIDTRKENWTIKVDGADYDWSDFLEKINKKIDSTTHSEDKMLGFYFCKAENNTINAECFVNKVAFYLWNDVFKDYGFDDAIFNDENGEKLSFRKFYKNDGTVEEAKVKTFLDKLGVIHQGETSVDIEEELQ